MTNQTHEKGSLENSAMTPGTTRYGSLHQNAPCLVGLPLVWCRQSPLVWGASPYPTGMALDELTERQKEILDLFVTQGLTYKEVAARCGISPETVNPHLKNAARKLQSGGISRAALKQALGARESGTATT